MLVETVGVGQVEVEIAGKADTTVVVVNPGWGDSVQANKAGLMEIADVFVINKADRKGVDETRRDLEQMLDLSDLAASWRPPIVPTVAHQTRGADELWEAVADHRAYAEESGRADAAARAPAARGAASRSSARRLERRARELCHGRPLRAARGRRPGPPDRPVVRGRRDAERPRRAEPV